LFGDTTAPGNSIKVDGNRAVWTVGEFIIVADLELRAILTCCRPVGIGDFVTSGNMVIFLHSDHWDNVALSARDISGDKGDHEYTIFRGGKSNWTFSVSPDDTILWAGPVADSGVTYIMLNQINENRCRVEALGPEAGEKIWFVEWSVPHGSYTVNTVAILWTSDGKYFLIEPCENASGWRCSTLCHRFSHRSH